MQQRSRQGSIKGATTANKPKEDRHLVSGLEHILFLENKINMFSSTAAVKRSTLVARRAIVRSSPRTQQTARHGSDMPVPQSQNAPLWHGHTVQKEGWEESMYFYFAAGVILQAAVLLAAPETSIESWARPEAKARLYLASKGQTEFEFGKHYQDVVEAENLELWSQFAAKAVTPGDDDDEDDEEDEDVSWSVWENV
jgi:hypothetical protein